LTFKHWERTLVAEAVGLILGMETLFLPIGDRDHLKAKKVANWIGTTKPCSVSFPLREEGPKK
jgi:hypothetical protein